MRKLVTLGVLAAALWFAPSSFAAGWCGAGEASADRPDVVTAQQIHTVVAVPSDGADTFPTDAPALADDVAAITAWWQGQDATRIPRFDQATFGTSTCLDISFVRLSRTAAAYTAAGPSGAFESIVDELGATGNLYKDYLVYYDGPAVEPEVCGTGGTRAFDTGLSFAVVWLQGCPGVPNSTIGAHELLHALGAVPSGAPHACLGDDGHVCDSVDDLMYPTTTGQSLSQLFLDFNHDDYYGHPGSWDDIQDSLWLHRLNVPAEPLNVSLKGSGQIKSDLPGVDCTAACTTQWDQGAALSLTATPGPGQRFVRWSGSCTGGILCALKLDAPATATALFGPLRVPLRISSAGRGTVACTPRCTKTFGGGKPLTLRAVPARGWQFARWSGGCKGTKLTCRPATDFAVSVLATFRRR